MPRVHYLQTAFVAGVLDPRLNARTDIRQYYQGMSVGLNVVVVPLGGVKRRPGMPFVDRLKNVLAALHSAATATAPNGGTANSAKDDDTATALLTTGNISTTNPYVVVHYDLGAASSVDVIDVVGLFLTSGSSTQFVVQSSSDNVSFSTRGTIPLVNGDAQGTQFVLTSAVSARYWRLARVGGTDLSTAKASLQDLLLWSESDTVSNVRLKSLESSTEDNFIVPITDRSACVYTGSILEATVPLPFESADIPLVDSDDSGDTLILVHQDYAPQQVYRDSLGDWYSADCPLTNIPDFDFNDALSPAVTVDVQDVTFTSFVEGNTFALELDGARSGVIVYQGVGAADNRNATAENIRRGVQKLFTVGLTGVSVAFTAGTTFRITFGEDSADNLALITGTPLTAAGAAAITAVKVANGVSRREPVWSVTRGWPRTVVFHEGRLWFGGCRSLPGALFGSVSNDPFNFFTGSGLDDDAIFRNPQEIRQVRALFSGRELEVFTSKAEFRFVNFPITPSNATPKKQTKYGAKQIKPVNTDGATVFIQKTGKVLRDFLFRYEEDNYSSIPLSQLASHLLNSCVDMAAWQGSGDDDANQTYIVNGDGTIAVYTNLRSQEIAAFSNWDTAGSFRAVGVVDQARYVASQRSIAGVSVLYLEMMDDASFLDASVIYAGAATATITGLSHLNAEECRARGDGFILANVTPAAGSATIEQASAQVEVGLNWTPRIDTMPLNNDFGNGDNFLRKKRVVKARIDVFNTLGLLYNGQPLPDHFFDITFGTPASPFSGAHSLEETSNWDEGPLVQSFTQVDPLPLHIRAFDFTVESS